MAKCPAKKLTRWEIVAIRKKGERVGYVSAENAKDAIRLAIEQFEIKDRERQRRLIAAANGAPRQPASFEAARPSAGDTTHGTCSEASVLGASGATSESL